VNQVSKTIYQASGKSDKIIVPEKAANKAYTGGGVAGGKGLG